MNDVKNNKCFATMTVTAKVFPLKKNASLIGNYGTSNREMLLCYGGLGDNGFITIKAVPTEKNPDFHKNLGFGLYDTIEVSGVIEEKEISDPETGISYNRTLKIIRNDQVKVIAKADNKSNDVKEIKKSAIAEVQGFIDSYVNDELVIAVITNPKYGEKKIHFTINNEQFQWLKENVNIGDMINVEGEHFNRINKDGEGNLVNKVKGLFLTKIQGYRKYVE